MQGAWKEERREGGGKENVKREGERKGGVRRRVKEEKGRGRGESKWGVGERV